MSDMIQKLQSPRSLSLLDTPQTNRAASDLHPLGLKVKNHVYVLGLTRSRCEHLVQLLERGSPPVSLERDCSPLPQLSKKQSAVVAKREGPP
jgi:hypothetical protein